jgi:hypothetical protein
MDLIHRRLLLFQATRDGEDLAGKTRTDLLFGSRLSLSRRQDGCFFCLFGHAFLGTGTNDGHQLDLELALGILRSESKKSENPGGKNFEARIDARDTNCQATG